jgi:hypothetical protein
MTVLNFDQGSCAEAYLLLSGSKRMGRIGRQTHLSSSYKVGDASHLNNQYQLSYSMLNFDQGQLC